MGVQKRDPIFYCDCCKRTVISALHLAKIKIPCRVYDEKGEDYVRQLTDANLCETCTNKFWEACDTHFAIVECSDVLHEIVITPHFEVDQIKYRDLTWPKPLGSAADEKDKVEL